MISNRQLTPPSVSHARQSNERRGRCRQWALTQPATAPTSRRCRQQLAVLPSNTCRHQHFQLKRQKKNSVIAAKTRCSIFWNFERKLKRLAKLSHSTWIQRHLHVTRSQQISAVRIFKSNRIVTSAFNSIRNEHNYSKFSNTYCHRFLTYLTEWRRFSL